MIKKGLNIVKKIIFGFIILYTFNIIAIPLNIIIGINFITVPVVGILGIPGLIMFIILKMFV